MIGRRKIIQTSGTHLWVLHCSTTIIADVAGICSAFSGCDVEQWTERPDATRELPLWILQLGAKLVWAQAGFQQCKQKFNSGG